MITNFWGSFNFCGYSFFVALEFRLWPPIFSSLQIWLNFVSNQISKKKIRPSFTTISYSWIINHHSVITFTSTWNKFFSGHCWKVLYWKFNRAILLQCVKFQPQQIRNIEMRAKTVRQNFAKKAFFRGQL